MTAFGTHRRTKPSLLGTVFFWMQVVRREEERERTYCIPWFLLRWWRGRGGGGGGGEAGHEVVASGILEGGEGEAEANMK
jgi:hypothetical protein